MTEAIALDAGTRAWALAALAEEAEFDRHVETVATAIADRFTLKVHVNIAAHRAAFADWIARVRAEDGRPIDHRAFVAISAGMVAALAGHRVVGYSAMIRGPSDVMVGILLKFGNEVTALAAGAAVYALAIEDLTGTSPADPLPPIVIESAAANLRKHPEAALRFRELLSLSTPWT